MEETIEIILQAIDEASSTFETISDAATSLGQNITDSVGTAGEDFDDLSTSAEDAGSSIETVADSMGNVNGTNIDEAAGAADNLTDSLESAANASNELGDSMEIITGSMILQASEQIGALASQSENMAQEMNQASITVGQLATQTGIAEPQMVSLINTISNATFPNDEAMMYVKSLDQIGVASENLGKSATDLDRINDAFHLGAQTTNSLGQELSVLGVDMNNVSSAFNALAYANANTVGGMENYYNFLRRYDAQFKELGLDVDQASVIIAAATQKFGGGRAALSGLNSALEECNGDTRKLEEALGLEAGALDHASELTGQYSGQLDQLAGEEAQHKTLLDQIGAAWEDVSLSIGNVMAPLAGVIGFIGQLGSFGMTIKGLREVATTLKAVATAENYAMIAGKARAAYQWVINAATIVYEGILAILTGELGLVAAATAVWNAILAMNPIMLVVIAIIALIAVIYEVGKAFGWWSDVSSMLDAIWAGIQRLWDAFINHPDVQAAIQAISAAWDWLSNAVAGAWNAVMQFFGVADSGEFDVVRAIIEAIGIAWQVMTAPIRLVITLLSMVYNAIMDVWNGNSWLGEAFQEVWGVVSSVISGIIMPLIEMFAGVVEIFAQVLEGNMTLGEAIPEVWQLISDTIGEILMLIIESLANFAMQLLTMAVQAGFNFLMGIITYIGQVPMQIYNYLASGIVYIQSTMANWVTAARQKAMEVLNGIVTWISQIPGRVYNYMVTTAGRIISGAAAWVSNARSKATETVNAVINAISGLPGKVYNEFIKIATRIRDSVSEAVRAATQFGQDVVNAVMSALGINSPGIIQNNTVAEFMNTIKRIGAAAGDAYNAGKEFGRSIVNGFGDVNLDDGLSTDLSTGGLFDVRTGEFYDVDNTQYIDGEITIVHDLKNVPEGIDEAALAEMLNESTQDESFVKRIAQNMNFQKYDLREKLKIERKNKRDTGVSG